MVTQLENPPAEAPEINGAQTSETTAPAHEQSPSEVIVEAHSDPLENQAEEVCPRLGIQPVKISKLTIVPQIQTLRPLDKDTAVKYSQVILDSRESKRPIPFPPITVFVDKKKKFVIAGGFHRIEAHTLAGENEIQCDVREGGEREALLFACGENVSHGLPRSDEDIKRAAVTLLQDPEWSQWSNVALGKLVGRSEFYVRTLRDELTPKEEQPTSRKFKGKSGKEKKTSVSGKGKAAKKGKLVADDKTTRALAKVVNVIGEAEEKKLLAAIESKKSGIQSNRDIVTLSEAKPAALKSVLPLVVSGTSPKKALALLEKETTVDSKVKDLFTQCDLRDGHFVLKINGYTLAVIDKHHKVTVE